jgi:hypothetical protein
LERAICFKKPHFERGGFATFPAGQNLGYGWGRSRTRTRGLVSCRIDCALPLQPAALAPKGWATRCTVLGLTLNLAATRRTDSPAFSATLIRFSRSAGIRGRPSCLPSALARLSPARTLS